MSKATLIGVLLAVAASSGCSKLIPKLDQVVTDNRKEYQKAQTLPDLEVPPELSTEAIRDRMTIPEGGEAARYSSYQERRANAQRAEELEKTQTAAIRVLENEHVLAVEGAPVQVWPRLGTFWQGQGYTLELDDVELGIMETAWKEDSARLTREKFKIFAEVGEKPGTSVLYISHESQELKPQGEDLVWQKRERDQDFEREIVERLQADLGGADRGNAVAAASAAPAQASSGGTAASGSEAVETGSSAASAGDGANPQHAELVSVGGGKFYLTVAEDFPSAWKTTGRALEKAGVDIKDSNKGRGVYIVEFAAGGDSAQEDSGVWDKLKFWGDSNSAEYQVSLTGVGAKTEVVVLDKNGRWETGDEAGTLLNKLHEALNSGQI